MLTAIACLCVPYPTLCFSQLFLQLHLFSPGQTIPSIKTLYSCGLNAHSHPLPVCTVPCASASCSSSSICSAQDRPSPAYRLYIAVSYMLTAIPCLCVPYPTLCFSQLFLQLHLFSPGQTITSI